MAARPRSALLASGGFAVLAVAVWAAAFELTPVARLDARVLHGFMGLDGPDATWLARHFALLAGPQLVAASTAVLLCVAIVGRGLRIAIAVAALLVGANLTAEALQHIVPSPRLDFLGPAQIGLGSWPSGHATAAMSVALAAVLAAPNGWRPVVAAAGGLFAVAIGYAILLDGWHLPSDVLGGFAIAGAWSVAGVAALRAADRRWPDRSGPGSAVRLADALRPSLLAGLVVVAVVLALALARLPDAVADVQVHTAAFVAGGLALGASGLGLAAGLAVALRLPQAGEASGRRSSRYR